MTKEEQDILDKNKSISTAEIEQDIKNTLIEYEKIINVIILNGPFKSTILEMFYSKIIYLSKGGEIIIYKECFRAVDGKSALYSLEGRSEEILDVRVNI